MLILFVASSNKTEELTCSIHKKLNEQISDHSLLIVGGVGGGGIRMISEGEESYGFQGERKGDQSSLTEY